MGCGEDCLHRSVKGDTVSGFDRFFSDGRSAGLQRIEPLDGQLTVAFGENRWNRQIRA